MFDERFPHVVLYVQDVEAGATQWHGVFLASQGEPGSRTPASAAKVAGLSVITVAKDAQVITGGPNGQAELHLGAGSEHEYDPHNRERYNVTTFGESDIPVQVSSAALPEKNAPLTIAEQSVSQRPTANTGPHATEARGRCFSGASRSLPLALCLRCWACRWEGKSPAKGAGLKADPRWLWC